VLSFGTSGCLQLTYFCYFCLVSCTIATLKGCGGFLEQPHHSLEFAIELSNQSGKPLLVYFPITDKYKHSNARYYKFMLDGILEAKKSVEERGIKFAIEKVNDIKQRIIELSENAYALITDKAYLKYYRKLNRDIAVLKVDIFNFFY
jgi:deoxyribodipyrimidine photo-lyase